MFSAFCSIKTTKKPAFRPVFGLILFERVAIQVLQGEQGYCHVCEEKQKQPNELRIPCAEELPDLSSADGVKYEIVS